MRINLFRKCCIVFMIVVLVAVSFYSCLDAISYEKTFDTTFTSPLGTRSVLVRYDYVSRPSVFSGGKRLFAYQGSGFNETVSWDVTWLTEQQIILSYNDKNDEYDEKFYIDIP